MGRLRSFAMFSMLWLGSFAWGQSSMPSQPDGEALLAEPLASMGVEDAEAELSRFKKQALQSVSLTAGRLADTGHGDLSSSFLDASIGSGIPLGSLDNILGVTPRFRIDWIDADPSIDIPSELYQFEVQFFSRRVLHDRLSAIFVFSPSIRSDLTTSDQALRIFALGLLNWQYMPDRLTLSGGAVVLGRADLPVLPAVGLTWTPSRKTQLDLRFPSSTLFHRLAKDGRSSEVWAYSSIGLGGNTWAVTRRSGQTDELSTRDIRFTVGLEKRLDGGGGWFVDGGYAVDRRLEYDSDDSQRQLSDAALFTAGWRY